MTPQLILTLSPSGALVAELPGPSGARRQVPLKAGKAEASLLRMLAAQMRSQVEIGLDGAPTAAQVRHWERHPLWRDPSCPFCIKELEAEGIKKQIRSPKANTVLKRGEVEVRRIKARGKRVMAVETKETTEELGL